jgi:hypothetical protein
MSLDVNLAVMAGRIAAPPELREFASGSRCLRYLITTRSITPSPRVDVLPVRLWEPPDGLVGVPGVAGERVWVIASVQRRFHDGADGRRSRLELVAHHLRVGPDADAAGGFDQV